ncbi:MAG: hypothetical protein JWM94_2368 [Sphingomonas bacterium]|nr:hypothetical protein [Sphingomonas bacterium]
MSCSGKPLGTPVKRRSRKEPRRRRKEEMLRHRDFVRPPVAGNAETLRMIAPGPDDRTGKLGGSSDQTGGPARDSDRFRVIGVEQIVTLEAPSGGESGASGGRGAFGRTDQSDREAEKALGPFLVERAKRGWFSDRPDGAKPQSCVGLRADATEQPAKPGAALRSSTDVASRRNQMARADLRESQADRSPATGESVARPAPQLRFRC